MPNIGEAISLSVYDMGGKVVLRCSPDRDTYTLDLTGLDSGIYLMRIDYNGKASDNLRFVKY